MKTRTALFAGCLAAAGWTFTPVILADEDNEVREWRSLSGKVIKGELIGVQDGKAIIRPETKLIHAPLHKLRESDRDFAEAWAKKQERLLADRAEADLLLAKSKPLGKALVGNTVKVQGKSIVPHTIKDISKVQFVLVYYSKAGAAGDVDSLNRLYKRLKNRYDNVEFVAIASTNSTAEADEFFIDAGIQFPAVRPNKLKGEGSRPLTQVFSRRVVPQIIVIDSTGKIVSDSYRAPDPEDKRQASSDGQWRGPKQDLKQPVEDLQKLLRAVSKGDGSE